MTTLATLVDQGLMAPDWAEALAPVEGRIADLQAFLGSEAAAGRDYLPAAGQVFRAFARPMADVRVLVVGQDPYPTPGHPVGLAFAVDPHVRPVPQSLANIYRVLQSDLGHPVPEHGDLTAWADAGVMLLNRVLTVQVGLSDSHRGQGWEQVTDQAVRALARRGGPLVAVLWGAKARSVQRHLGDVPVITSSHPSPLSAYRGFLDSTPFSEADAELVGQGGTPLDWSLPLT